MSTTPNATSRNIVLVHGGFVDGSGWEAVYRVLRKEGHTVSVVQNPTISLRACLESLSVLIGIGYPGGHDDPTAISDRLDRSRMAFDPASGAQSQSRRATRSVPEA
jgi:hypothetical protein